MPSDIERSFFDRIRDEPDDDVPRLIYADWLADHGEPERAEFIRLQCALARLGEGDPLRTALRECEQGLIETHLQAWKEPLAPFVTEVEFRRGIIDSVSMKVRQFREHGHEVFALAPIRKIRFLHVGPYGLEIEGSEIIPQLPPPTRADHREHLLQSSLLRQLREVDFSGNDLSDEGLIALARSPHLTRLDTLNLGFTSIGDEGLTALANSAILCQLRCLYLNDNDQLGALGLQALADSPYLEELRELDLGGNRLSDAAMRPILHGSLADQLHRLVLVGNRLGDSGVASFVRTLVFTRMAERDRSVDLRRVEMGPRGARALAETSALQAVECLHLEGNPLGDAGLMALAETACVRNLRVLNLRECRISDDGIRVLARSPLMASLRVLDLTGNLITQESADLLQEASVGYDWRGLLELKVDSQLRSRPAVSGIRSGFVRPPTP